MKRLGTIGVAAVAFGVLAVQAHAQTDAVALPNWRIADICARESAPGQCAEFEARALKSVSASWPFLLEPIKTSCLSQTTNPLDRSWRELADCIDNASARALDRRAVMTARTPAEPVPPARMLMQPLAPDLVPQTDGQPKG